MEKLKQCPKCIERSEMWKKRIKQLNSVNSITVSWEGGGTEFSAMEGFPFQTIVDAVSHNLEGFLSGCCPKCTWENDE